MTVHAIKQTPPARSPERQALAAAIEAHAEAKRAAEAGREAVARAEALAIAAGSRLASANADVGRAKERHTADVAAAVAAGHAIPTSALRSARADAQTKQDDLDALTAALEQLQTQLAELEAQASRSELAVEAAINAVLAPRGSQFARDLVARRSESLALLAHLCFIRDRGGERRGDIFSPIRELSAPLANVTPEIDRVLGLGVTYQDMEAARAHAAVEALQEACAAMRADPDAPLPPLLS
jgi:hypothetical protein